MSAETTPNLWQNGFIFANLPALDKAETIIDEGPDTLALIFDWDGVVTPNDPASMGGTNWAVLKRMMTTESLARHEQLFHEFRPLEEHGLLTAESADSWQRQAMELLIGASIQDIEQDAQRSNVALRPGMKQLFDIAEVAKIPTFIKSAGERHIIEAVAQHHGLAPARIFANEFTVDKGIVTGVHEASLTHSLNKHTYSHKLAKGYELHQTAIVVGDNLHDAHMIEDETEDTVLRVRVDTGRAAYIDRYGDNAWQAYLANSFKEGFDMVAIHEDVTALTSLIHAAVARKHV
jgi:HAD superfamily phosphoserine phosphatase-like hydrolase